MKVFHSLPVGKEMVVYSSNIATIGTNIPHNRSHCNSSRACINIGFYDKTVSLHPYLSDMNIG